MRIDTSSAAAGRICVVAADAAALAALTVAPIPATLPAACATKPGEIDTYDIWASPGGRLRWAVPGTLQGHQAGTLPNTRHFVHLLPPARWGRLSAARAASRGPQNGRTTKGVRWPPIHFLPPYLFK